MAGFLYVTKNLLFFDILYRFNRNAQTPKSVFS